MAKVLTQHTNDSIRSSMIKGGGGGRVTSLDADQLEYTAEKIFTYSTILVAVVGVYLAVGYTMGKKLTS